MKPEHDGQPDELAYTVSGNQKLTWLWGILGTGDEWGWIEVQREPA